MRDVQLAERVYERSSDAADAVYCILLAFILMGLVERIGYVSLRCRRMADGPSRSAGCLPPPDSLPRVCTQLAMYNEAACAIRVIDAACSLNWPRDKHEIQVLDDSTDPDVRAAVDACVNQWQVRGVDCRVIRRERRTGFKAGALELGRHSTDATFLAMFDADFVPAPDFLHQTIPHFYDDKGQLIKHLALVQARWAHLNMSESLLTLAQSLWIDDHHISQMVWRSSVWKFVNFTGTAGVWRAEAISVAGGWRASSLVEDCELSFRTLFCGYETAFVPVDVPAELVGSVAAYKAQQRRWTLGWAQLIRLHLGSLLLRHKCSFIKRLHLTYHMLLSIQWPLWFAWQVITPCIADYRAHVEPSHGAFLRFIFYACPLAFHMILASAIVACERLETVKQHTAWARIPKPLVWCLLFLRVVPTAFLSAAMLPHQACAWFEGILSHTAEFETTPKSGATDAVGTGQVGSNAAGTTRARTQRWYVVVEAAFVLYQLSWFCHFCGEGHYSLALGSSFPAFSVGCLWASTCLSACASRILTSVSRSHGAFPSWRAPTQLSNVGGEHLLA